MSRAQKSIVGATLAVVVVAGTLAGCASQRPITLNSVAVTKAGEAMESMDAMFRADLDEVQGDIAIAVSEDSRCYFQVAKNDAMSETSVCGPVWRLGDDAPNWTTMALDISGDGFLGIETSGSTVDLEKDKTLYRPDGRTFDKKMQLEEPPAPNSAKPGEVVVLDGQDHLGKYDEMAERQVATIVSDDPSAVLTPDFLFSINEARRAVRVGGHDDRTETKEGYEFALVDLSVAAWKETSVKPDVLPEISLIADDTKTPVDVISYAELIESAIETNVKFALSIPDDTSELTLEIAFNGVTQTIDLAERLRDSTTVPAYYDGLAFSAAKNDGVVKKTVPTSEGWEERWHLNTLRAERTPYLDGAWAPDGQTFIALSVTGPGSVAWWKGARAYSDHYATTALTPTFTLTSDDGTVFTQTRAAVEGGITTVYSAVFTVPAEMGRFDLGGELNFDMVRRDYHLVPSSPAKASVAFSVPAYAFGFGE